MTDHVLAAACGLLGGALVAGLAFVYFLCAQRSNRKVSP